MSIEHKIYALSATSSVWEYLKKQEKSHRRLLGYAIWLLQQNPRRQDTKKLKASINTYRFRVPNLSDHRIVYQIKDASIEILVIKIGNRRDIYDK
jgi:mRNA interferase RelE/StbE